MWHGEMEHASQLLMLQVIDNPELLSKHILSYAGTLILNISHGYDPLRENDPLVSLAEQSIRDVGEAFELGKWWVEFFPWRAFFLWFMARFRPER